jgi:hypothetical protein
MILTLPALSSQVVCCIALSTHSSIGWSIFPLSSMSSNALHLAILGKASAGLKLVLINPIVSILPSFYASLAAVMSIINLFSVVVVDREMTSNRDSESVKAWIGMLPQIIRSTSCFSITAMSIPSANAMTSPPNTDLVTLLDLWL